MKTLVWQRKSRIDDHEWDLSLTNGRLNLWRDSFAIATAYGGRSIEWMKIAWPDEIVVAWREMLDAMKKEEMR